MNLVTKKCPNCGADIKIDMNSGNSVCKYCGSTVVLEDVLDNIIDDSEKVNTIRKFIEIDEYENALEYINAILKDDPLNKFALIYQVKIMVYLFDFVNFDTKSTNFSDKNWKKLRLILKNYYRVCKIHNGVPQEFLDIQNKIEVLQKWDKLRTEENITADTISQKLNLIFNNYKGDKNLLLRYLKKRIGLVNSGRTIAKIAMMREAHNYVEEDFNEPFTAFIEDKVLKRFEYKRDGSVEATYDSDNEDMFAIEYYGKIKKYTDLKELVDALDSIIAEIKCK